MSRSKTLPPKRSQKKDSTKEDIDLERGKIILEREKLAFEMEKLAVEKEKIILKKTQHLRNIEAENDTLPFKVKLQPFDPKHDDVLTFVSEFDAVADKAKWNSSLRLLQQRTLLSGDARHQASTSYEELRKALINRYRRRPHEYCLDLVNIKKKNNEKYRALVYRVDINLKRCVMDRDPIECLQHEFLLEALPSSQAQRIRQ